MKKETLFVAGLAGILIYLYFKASKKKDKGTIKAELPPPQLGGGQEPTLTTKTTNQNASVKTPITVDDLSKKEILTVVPQVLVAPAESPSKLKEPIFIRATNVWPNIYDRGVGAPMPIKRLDDQYYASFAGPCSENMMNACRCVKEKDKKYKLDIPKLP